MKEVADTLKKHAIGRGISRDNIIALVQIAGLEIAPIDNDKPDTVNILGQRIIDMEVDFNAQQKDLVDRVQLKLMLPDQDEPVQQPQMSQILKQNLTDKVQRDVPWTLLDEIDAEAIDVSSTVVSTWMTLIPAFFIDSIGAIRAWLSVGAIITAAGLVAVTASTIGICSLGAKSAGPWTLIE